MSEIMPYRTKYEVKETTEQMLLHILQKFPHKRIKLN